MLDSPRKRKAHRWVDWESDANEGVGASASGMLDLSRTWKTKSGVTL